MTCHILCLFLTTISTNAIIVVLDVSWVNLSSKNEITPADSWLLFILKPEARIKLLWLFVEFLEVSLEFFSIKYTDSHRFITAGLTPCCSIFISTHPVRIL